jgi:hypothetical protein
MQKVKYLIAAIVLVSLGMLMPVRTDTAAEQAPITPIPAEAVCQDPYYLVSSGPDEPTVCALKEGFTDCHNFTAVPNGQTCDPATAPKPYVEPTPVTPAPAKKCEE